MEATPSVVLVCVWLCFHGVRSQETYDTYDLNSVTLCADREFGSIYIKPWKAAVLTYGNPPGSNQSSPGHGISKCKVSIRTWEDFGLGAVIQDMSIEATMDKKTHAWECDENYIKISTVGTSTISKLLSLIPLDSFKSKKTDDLCGTRKGKPRFSEVGSNADVFSTLTNNMEVEFHQQLKKAASLNNSFRIIITTFKHVKEVEFSEACQGKYQCKGSENYCISPEYVCDHNYNCAVPLGGGDELKCKDPEFYHPIFSTTTTIITVLAAIVGSAFLLGCIITMFRKMSSQRSLQSRSVTPRPGQRSEVSAPSLQRQHTLPPYEAVVMADADPTWKSSTPEPLPPGELPPNYDSLFPDGPPKTLGAPPTAPSINNQPTAPTIQDIQPQETEQRSNAATIPAAES